MRLRSNSKRWNGKSDKCSWKWKEVAGMHRVMLTATYQKSKHIFRRFTNVHRKIAPKSELMMKLEMMRIPSLFATLICCNLRILTWKLSKTTVELTRKSNIDESDKFISRKLSPIRRMRLNVKYKKLWNPIICEVNRIGSNLFVWKLPVFAIFLIN